MINQRLLEIIYEHKVIGYNDLCLRANCSASQVHFRCSELMIGGLVGYCGQACEFFYVEDAWVAQP